MQLTLQQLFGVNVSEGSQVFTISKSDLPLLTPSVSNTAESLLVALLLKAIDNFQGLITDENGEPITDENNRPIEYNNGDIFTNLYLFFWKSYIAERGDGYMVRDSIVIQYYGETDVGTD